jgi:hypothetical protein
MRSEEQLRAAYRGADLPWPDETGAYERFLRRRARRARRVRVGAGVGLAALLTLAVVTATLQPWAPPDRQHTTPGSQPRYDPQLQRSLFGRVFRPIEGPIVVASGQQSGFRWTLGAERAFVVAPFPGSLLGAPEPCVGFNVSLNHPSPSRATGSLAAKCADEAVQVTSDSVGVPGKTALFGMVPAATARIQIGVRGKAPLLIEPLATAPRFDRRYYLAFLPRSYSVAQGDIVQVERAVALDATGRELARWRRAWPFQVRRGDHRGVVVAQAPSAGGTWRLESFHHQRSQCIDLHAPAGAKVDGDYPICEADPGWLASNLRPFGSCAGGAFAAYGVAPATARTVRFTFTNAKPVEARTIQAPPGFTGSFYLVQLPTAATGIRTTALSQDGTMIASSLLAGCHQ